MKDSMQKKLLDKFYKGTLSNKDKGEFSRQLELDGFKERLAEGVIKHHARIQLKEQLGNIHLEMQQAEQKATTRNYLMALGVLLLLALGAAFWYFSGDTNKESIPKEELPEVLFAEHFKTYPNITSVRSIEDEKNNWEKAMDAYKEEDFRTAVKLFSGIPDTMSNAYMFYFYKGNALMSIEEYKEAEKAFLETTKTDNDLKIDALWYLGLIALKNNNLEEVKRIFGTIQTQYPNYKKAAVSDILEQLEY